MSLMTQAEYSRHRNISRAAVTKFKNLGYLKGAFKKKGKRIDPVIADRLLEERLNKAYQKNRTKPLKKKDSSKKPPKTELTEGDENILIGMGGLDKETFSEARTRKERALAGLRELELEKEKERSISLDTVEKAFFEAGRQTRDQCQAIPDRVAALVAAESDTFECKKILQTEIDYVLEGLSSALQMPE